MKNLTKETFCAEMEKIDAELKGLEIEIAVRPIRALSELSKRFGVGFPVVFGQVTDESPYVPGLLPSHVQRWYDVRYGDRMKLQALSPGKIAIEIGGDVWPLHLPFLYGTVTFVAGPLAARGKNGRKTRARYERRF